MLSFISLGVWLTFAIGRINIGQGGFAMIGGYVSAILVSQFERLFLALSADFGRRRGPHRHAPSAGGSCGSRASISR